jgi:hypothetical protein
MVSGRRRQLDAQTAGNQYSKYDHVDLENGNGEHATVHPRMRFRDAIETTMSQSRALDMKKKLLETMNHEFMEKFRLSEEEVQPIHPIS